MAIAAPSSLPGPLELFFDPASLMNLPPVAAVGDAAEELRELAARMDDAVTPGLLVGAATLQACLVALVAAYDHYQPGALARAAVLDGAEPTQLATVLVAEALRSNPALAPLAPCWIAAPVPEACRTHLLFEEPALDGRSLPALLRAAQTEAPDALEEQLAWLARVFGPLLPPSLLDAALLGRDLIVEEHTAVWGPPGPFEAPSFGPGPAEELVAFSEDRHWMPGVVLIAKQAFVWLDQLSRAYGREIRTLDAVPDAELDVIASRGFNALWLIGLWERSPASRTIKRRCGNPEAEASAYALKDYVIAERLGGEDAWRALRDRASARGIRLASDMVPNHVGLDARWIAEHPDWFLHLDAPPYPGYRFDGPDLSADPRISVHLEDGYWDRSDAAVVFKHVEHSTGRERFVYHGNDGTQMPWNDTAQIDYLNPAAREAVIQTILAVARRFPIIRFDAAMTLAKKHVKRLWHPAPGDGGAIPSRAAHGVSEEAFDAAMPREFWREVVERIGAEAPDTLLLAEAFWMMEGYFVRTLGMHRVYNSAFMHMLRDEDTGAFRGMIKEVLATSPGILERFVNFVNNPDEDTAAAQFGKGDKYFGVATMMATLPGLPMFGHGQVEGFEEKYGMEYARAYRDEEPDGGFVAHHESVIFPLLRRRTLFSGVEHFALYDFGRGDGSVNDDVLAFSNRDGSGRSLVLFNNSAQRTSGRIRVAAPVNVAAPEDDPQLTSRPLTEALGLDPTALYGLRELRDGLWFLRSGRELGEDGLFAELDGYRAQVFMDWRELRGADWEALAAHLSGRGVPDLDAALQDLLHPAVIETESPEEPVVDEPLVESDPVASADAATL